MRIQSMDYYGPQKQFREALKPIADLHQELQIAMRPIADLELKTKAIRASVFNAPEFDSAVRELIERQNGIAKAIKNLGLEPIHAATRKLSESMRKTRALDDAGWLPHYSTPFATVEYWSGDIAALRVNLEKYYQESWLNVRKEIELRLAKQDLDAEAKRTFHEALMAHENGLYRCVCRVLLLEIEQVVRKELHGNRLERITSQSLLIKLAGNMALTYLEPKGFYSVNLFKRLSDHLYEDIKNESDRRRFEMDPIPNRHAAVHGLVAYSSMQNSLNTIFMADYIFQIIDFVKNPNNDQS